jgi:type 1 fimbria pilin
VNKLSGNDNIGIQLVHNNNAMKIGENIELLSAAADSENLKFNAYYYYKGGAVQSGPIKSQTDLYLRITCSFSGALSWGPGASCCGAARAVTITAL